MAPNDNMLNLEMLHCMLNNSIQIIVSAYHKIGNIPVNKYFSRFQ